MEPFDFFKGFVILYLSIMTPIGLYKYFSAPEFDPPPPLDYSKTTDVIEEFLSADNPEDLTNTWVRGVWTIIDDSYYYQERICCPNDEDSVGIVEFELPNHEATIKYHYLLYEEGRIDPLMYSRFQTKMRIAGDPMPVYGQIQYITYDENGDVEHIHIYSKDYVRRKIWK
jgi:hypothetical protein